MPTLREALAPQWWEPVEGCGVKYLLAPLDQFTAHDVKNELDWIRRKISGAGVRKAVEASLRDWQGWNDEEGNPIPFSLVRVEHVPMDHLVAIALHVYNLATMTEEDLKNLSAQSKSNGTLKASTARTAPVSTESPSTSAGESQE